VVEITELLWDDQNIAHIARHNVTVVEVSEVVFGESALFFELDQPNRPGRVASFGVTSAGRARDLSRHPDVSGWELRPHRASSDG
jgi:hypothetical protein